MSAILALLGVLLAVLAVACHMTGHPGPVLVLVAVSIVLSVSAVGVVFL